MLVVTVVGFATSNEDGQGFYIEQTEKETIPDALAVIRFAFFVIKIGFRIQTRFEADLAAYPCLSLSCLPTAPSRTSVRVIT